MLATDIEGQMQRNDPALFPGKMPDEDLAQLPPTVICTGEFDYFRRESEKLIPRLRQANRLLDVLDMPQTFNAYENDVESPAALKAEEETIKVWNKFVLNK